MGIRTILVKRDGMTPREAQILIDEARKALQEYIENNDEVAAYDICEEFFGLEPDYIMELL